MGTADRWTPALRAFGSLLDLWPAGHTYRAGGRGESVCAPQISDGEPGRDRPEDWHRMSLAWLAAWVDALEAWSGGSPPDRQTVAYISEWLTYLEAAPPRVTSGVGGRHTDRVKLAADRFRVRRAQVGTVRQRLDRLATATGVGS